MMVDTEDWWWSSAIRDMLGMALFYPAGIRHSMTPMVGTGWALEFW